MSNGKRLDTGNLNPTHAVVLITPMHQRKRGIMQEQSTVPNRNNRRKKLTIRAHACTRLDGISRSSSVPACLVHLF